MLALLVPLIQCLLCFNLLFILLLHFLLLFFIELSQFVLSIHLWFCDFFLFLFSKVIIWILLSIGWYAKLHWFETSISSLAKSICSKWLTLRSEATIPKRIIILLCKSCSRICLPLHTTSCTKTWCITWSMKSWMIWLITSPDEIIKIMMFLLMLWWWLFRFLGF